jgi:hypothetical protein
VCSWPDSGEYALSQEGPRGCGLDAVVM